MRKQHECYADMGPERTARGVHQND